MSSAYIKVWGYVGNKSATNNFPYAAGENDDINNDTDNWVQLGEHAITTGTATYTATVFQIEGTNQSTTYTQHFSTDICFPKLRFTAYCDAIFEHKGTLTIVALVQ